METKYIYFAFVLFFSCTIDDSVLNPISNDIEFEKQYEVNLDWSDIVSESNTEVNIIWNKWIQSNENENFYRYNIMQMVPSEGEGNPDQANIIDYNSNLLDTSYIINLQNAGTFLKFCIHASYYDNADSINFISSDTVQFFTQPLRPATNIAIDMNSDENTHTLNWEPSINTEVNNLVIYRSSIEDGDLPPDLVINLSTSEPSNINNQWEILYNGDSSIEQFITELISSWYKYFYLIKVINSEENNIDNISSYRYSFIEPAVPDMINEISLDTLIFNTSNEFEDVIVISWDSYMDSDFYSYEIWRANNPNSEGINLVEIVDQELNYFEDRYNIGSGVKWYYFIRLYNSYGSMIESSIKMGETRL